MTRQIRKLLGNCCKITIAVLQEEGNYLVLVSSMLIFFLQKALFTVNLELTEMLFRIRIH